MLLLLRYRYSTPPMPFVVVDLSPSQPRLFPFLSKKSDGVSDMACACCG
jgi:hypothetical protein